MGVAGSPPAACVGWARAAADLRVLLAAQEPWPPPDRPAPNFTSAGAAAEPLPPVGRRGAAPRPGFDVAMKLGIDMDTLATSVCLARALAAAAAGSALLARLRAPGAASSLDAARPEAADAPEVPSEGPPNLFLAGGSGRVSDPAEPGPATQGGAAAVAHRGAPGWPDPRNPGSNPLVRVQWEAALQLGGLSRLVLLPAGGGRALQFRLASAAAHAASAELAQADLGGRAVELLPLRCGGLGVQVRAGARLCTIQTRLRVETDCALTLLPCARCRCWRAAGCPARAHLQWPWCPVKDS